MSGDVNRRITRADVAAGVARTPSMKRELAERWRARAHALDLYARQCRRYGDTLEAQDAEQAARDYRVAADKLELELPELPAVDE